MYLKLDFRLIEIGFEIDALERNLKLIIDLLPQLRESNNLKFEEYCRKNRLNPGDPDWDFTRQEFNCGVELITPRFLIGSFIISIYSVFETSITEIAKLIQQTQNQKISINDLRGYFNERAEKYFDHILNFEYYRDTSFKIAIEILTEVRNAIVHANGRVEMLKEHNRQKLERWSKDNQGITFYNGYLFVEIDCARQIFNKVKLFLEDLVKRYKEWDNKQKTKS